MRPTTTWEVFDRVKVNRVIFNILGYFSGLHSSVVFSRLAKIKRETGYERFVYGCIIHDESLRRF